MNIEEQCAREEQSRDPGNSTFIATWTDVKKTRPNANDHSVILTYSLDGDIRIATWNIQGYSITSDELTNWCVVDVDDEPHEIEFTHWMPVAEPPNCNQVRVDTQHMELKSKYHKLKKAYLEHLRGDTCYFVPSDQSDSE
jgi:hypothetical protein